MIIVLIKYFTDYRKAADILADRGEIALLAQPATSGNLRSTAPSYLHLYNHYVLLFIRLVSLAARYSSMNPLKS